MTILKKRLMLFCALICMVAMSLGLLLFNNSILVKADTNDLNQLSFTLLSNDTYSVSAKTSEKSNITEIVIPAYYNGKEVTEISTNGFMSCANLKKVFLSPKLIKIGNSAFSGCKNLEIVSMTNVEYIGQNAFAACTSLEDFIVPKSVEYIGSTAFRSNSNNIEIRKSAEECISFAANCFSSSTTTVMYDFEEIVYSDVKNTEGEVIGYSIELAQNIEAPNGVFIIDKHKKEDEEHSSLGELPIRNIQFNAFYGTSLQTLIIAPSEQTINIESEAFAYSKIKEFEFYGSISFYDYFELEPETDTDGLPSTNVFAFSEIESIFLPINTKEILEGMFQSCNALKYIGRDNHLPNSIQKIGDYAFADCTNLSYLYIPDSMIKTADGLGMGVFQNWTNSQKIEFAFEKPEEWSDFNFFAEDDSNPIPEEDKPTMVWGTLKYNVAFYSDGTKLFTLSKEPPFTLNDLMADFNYNEPEKETQVFTGWYFDADCTESCPNDYSFTGNVSLYAGWTDKKYKIDFIEDKSVNIQILNLPGQEGISEGYIKHGESLMFNVFVNEGYDNSTLTVTANNILIPSSIITYSIENITENQLIRAWAQAFTYSITYYIDGEKYAGQPNTYTVCSSVILPEPEKSGYDFEGWYISGENSENPIKTINEGETGNKVFYGTFVNRNYIVTFDANGGDPLNPKNQNVKFDMNYTLPIPTRTGYDFVGWYSEEVGGVQYTYSNGESINVWKDTEDKTLYAHWAAKEFTVTLELNGGDYVYPESVKVKFNSTYTLPIPTRTGYDFVGWYSEEVGGVQYTYSNGESINIWEDTEDKTLYAHWKAKDYIITIEINGYEYSVTVTFDKDYNLPVPGADIGYEFVGWYYLSKQYTDSTGKSIGVWKDTSNRTLTAKQNALTYYITADYAGYGDSVSSVVYEPKKNLSSLFKSPTNLDSKLQFAGWYLDDTFDMPLPSSMESISANILNSSSHAFTIYAKLTVNSSNTEFTVPEKCTRLYFGSANSNLRIIIPKVIKTSSLIFEDFVSIQTSNFSVIDIWEADSTTYLYFKGNNEIKGGDGANGANGADGSPAINCKGANLYINVINDGSLVLIGGNGGAGTYYGGNGAPGLFVTSHLDFTGTSDNKNSYYSPYEYEGVIYSDIIILGGNGGSGTYSGGNGGNGVTVTYSDFISGNRVWFTLEYTALFIRGGNGGDITDKDKNGYGIGGNGGNGFECNNDAYFFGGLWGGMQIYGGNGGDSGTSTDALGSCGGYGIYSHWGDIGIYNFTQIFGGNAGNHKFGKVSGGIGLKCKKLISRYTIEITGGQGSSSDITRFCGTGGTAATIEAITGSGYSIIFRGGKGGMNTIKGEKGGLGYTFSYEEKFNSVIYYNGEDWIG